MKPTRINRALQSELENYLQSDYDSLQEKIELLKLIKLNFNDLFLTNEPLKHRLEFGDPTRPEPKPWYARWPKFSASNPENAPTAKKTSSKWIFPLDALAAENVAPPPLNAYSLKMSGLSQKRTTASNVMEPRLQPMAKNLRNRLNLTQDESKTKRHVKVAMKEISAAQAKSEGF